MAKAQNVMFKKRRAKVQIWRQVKADRCFQHYFQDVC
jgi:hypothetical protein